MNAKTTTSAFRRVVIALLPAAGLCILSSCRLLVGTTAVAVGAVGLVGYGVYKTGEAAVTGVGSAASSVAKGSASVVFVSGEFKAMFDGSVEDVWQASGRTLQANGFQSMSGNRDARSGRLQARTWDDQGIVIRLDASGQGQTALRMRIGVAGDLKKSETLYEMITAELAGRQGTT
ncbi:MAG: DUF3568 family protein [Phycisphaeraceae bacterium]|nr:DUF3568 family protein [Phycisphaeraceae bacterium]